MMNETLTKLNLPKLLNRDEMLNILFDQQYGYIPAAPSKVSYSVEENTVFNFCAGKAVLNKVTMSCEINGKAFSFPFYLTLPTAEGKHPFFVHINFRDLVPDRYMPTEELVDNGFAILSFCYLDVTSDDGDFTNGLAGVLYEDGKRGPTDAGKIAMWAWAAHRVMDYAQTLDNVLDLNNAIVCGHSRLGKTALLAAATDERFTVGYSNDSGCSGAAISRITTGENVKDICTVFPYWFCENYYRYMENEDNMPFDQHYLLASIAPRKVVIGSASKDFWADPVAEQLSCFAASPAFKNGFVCPDRKAEAGEEFFEGDVGYHLRPGLHYFSREDWLKLIKYVKLHFVK